MKARLCIEFAFYADVEVPDDLSDTEGLEQAAMERADEVSAPIWRRFTDSAAELLADPMLEGVEVGWAGTSVTDPETGEELWEAL